MASTYKAYLGEGLGPLGKLMLPLKIPHPGKVGGYVAMNLVMPTMLSWVLGGNLSVFKTADRKPVCHLCDKPKHFDEQDFYKFLKDDRLLLQAADAKWTLVPSQTRSLYHSSKVDVTPAHDANEPDLTTHLSQGSHIHGLRIAFPEEAVEICIDHGCTVGRGVDNHIQLDNPLVSMRHAHLCKEGGDFWITDLGSAEGTWLNGSRLGVQKKQRVTPGDEVAFGRKGVPDLTFKVKMVHSSVWEQVQRTDSQDMDAPKALKPVSA